MYSAITLIFATAVLHCNGAVLLGSFPILSTRRRESQIDIEHLPFRLYERSYHSPERTPSIYENIPVERSGRRNFRKSRETGEMMDIPSVGMYRAKRRNNKRSYIDLPIPMRRVYFEFHPQSVSTILGAPSDISHLPPAEPILPGHTLLRPALGMLKSQVKFPHRELENGAGVYGNIANLGLKYGNRNERVVYTGFRRMHPTRRFYPARRASANYIMLAPTSKNQKLKPSFQISSINLDLDKKQASAKKLIQSLLGRSPPITNSIILIAADLRNKDYAPLSYNKEKSMYYSDGYERDDEDTDKEEYYYKPVDKSLHDLATDTIRRFIHRLGTFRPRKKIMRSTNATVSRSHLLQPLRNRKPKGHHIHNHLIENTTRTTWLLKDAIANEDIRMTSLRDEEPKIDKQTMLKYSKYAFNNIKFDKEAPDFAALVPFNTSESEDEVEESNDKKSWWFYNQVDFKTLTSE
ncbi:uncharacterized protein LOC113232881 isoform X3 [Hyposmocoma kahamanoa]|uniref:uncharacterized protein LOC113232881 isoform X3 n=1 Tax=Hyposmocoma kahamanoa TaxID=1477025 RepID=UPI000E6D69D7|nr:uncharacterized protein LOC113232881 isoform X3 [Hyposmocoma kahamanoa]